MIDAAAELADRDGFEAVTMSSVARHVDVKPASLYEHVQHHAALLDGVHQLALGQLAATIADAIAGLSGDAALRGFADAHRTYASRRPGMWSALQHPAAVETARSPEAERVASLTIAVLRGYQIPRSGVVHAARLVAATLNGFLALTRTGAFAHRPEPPDESWSAALDALDRALRTWPQRGEES
ncbi:TetR/AcrR family transcriptional regulator [Micromonospora sp. WMMD1082]|uniref:TetR/AcrR family transcriptional regulator n=1 Tax=Micromonospora sp. WMMD1082 TaxID=3016104 RepID=UPI0024174302|nr:TetR/AcrR family transcriptional regulator [Micromonospora sp. WMMD1082]MDG4798145.1 WHG domain-containing protein [Micromonospora sp. WMMD1082]